MATFQIPFGLAQEWQPKQREPLYVEQARAAATDQEAQEHIVVSLPPELSRTVAAAASREGVSARAWLVRELTRTAPAGS